MGWLTHEFEADYTFPEATPQEIYEELQRQMQVIERYEIKETVEANLEIVGTHTTKRKAYVDDMRLSCVANEGGGCLLKTWSKSREGLSDLFQNRRNVRQLVRGARDGNPTKFAFKEKIFKQ